MTVRSVGSSLWLLTMAVLGAWIGYMYIDTEQPYIYDVEHSRVIPDPAVEGGVITVDWAIAKVNRKCPGTSQRYFRDMETKQIVATLDTTPMSRAVKMEDKRLPRTFTLPPDLPPVVGYSTEICVECNLLQKFFPLCFMTPEIVFRVTQQN